tara:strand:+ start:335 stop:547 length:213 start_codon:yes stop_codon:yes gene_type:complete
MAKEKKKAEEPTVSIDGTEYKASDLTEEQIMFVNHVADLDRKMGSSQFNLQQLAGGKDYFMARLKESLAG